MAPKLAWYMLCIRRKGRRWQHRPRVSMDEPRGSCCVGHTHPTAKGNSHRRGVCCGSSRDKPPLPLRMRRSRPVPAATGSSSSGSASTSRSLTAVCRPACGQRVAMRAISSWATWAWGHNGACARVKATWDETSTGETRERVLKPVYLLARAVREDALQDAVHFVVGVFAPRSQLAYERRKLVSRQVAEAARVVSWPFYAWQVEKSEGSETEAKRIWCDQGLRQGPRVNDPPIICACTSGLGAS